MAKFSNAPVFFCDEIVNEVGQEGWTFWCPFCHYDHFHGAVRGHREAHCASESPLRQTGYILEKRDPKRKPSTRQRKFKL